jgi:ATP-dependent DNA ligase
MRSALDSRKAPTAKTSFIEPMLLLGTDKLPEGPAWRYELKLDGYRALAIKSSGTVRLVSRHNNDFTALYSGVAKALSKMPDDTVLDGEVVALDQSGRPDFNTLQNYGASSARIVYFVFDVPILKGRDLASEPLTRRVELLETTVMPQLAEPVRLSPAFEVSLRAWWSPFVRRGWKASSRSAVTRGTSLDNVPALGRNCALIAARGS